MAWKRCALAGPSSCQNDILCTRFSGFVWAKFDKEKEQSAFRLFDFFIISSRSMRDSVNRPPTPDDTAEEEEKQPTLQETINIKLIESGEKERLMELLRERLIECGWKDEMKALCRIIRCNGRSCSLRYDGADAECVLQVLPSPSKSAKNLVPDLWILPQGNALDRDAASFWLNEWSPPSGNLCSHTSLREFWKRMTGEGIMKDMLSLAAGDCTRILTFLSLAFIKKKGRNNVTVDDLVHVITPKGRVSIPDSVKAELLQRIRSFLVQAAV
ncbi:hypothetical protein OIU77_016338 [Salix suchowensis]|uniref:Transcription and mRNA export factor ENY2 n=1 Tax=Salix suchowensis TaxID=1278906 RepID=A0ABQ8ZKI0_9ROSI|nr:hypothetical protein OIU77_016338 [Salix suchowensis]KAJ6314859.1 hypothetical protein OIU78_018361 [Salix suchowensis]